jgi:uncharacterized membrane protein
MTMMHPGWMAWGGLGSALGWLAALALTIAVAVALARALLPRPPEPRGPDVALDVLRTRFAGGEIDESEYLQRRAALTHPHEGAPS